MTLRPPGTPDVNDEKYRGNTVFTEHDVYRWSGCVLHDHNVQLYNDMKYP